MSNASPLKEPSMDEILASIRRIIETGDETRRPLARGTVATRAPERTLDIGSAANAESGGQAEPAILPPLPRFGVSYQRFRDETTASAEPTPREDLTALLQRMPAADAYVDGRDADVVDRESVASAETTHADHAPEPAADAVLDIASDPFEPASVLPVPNNENTLDDAAEVSSATPEALLAEPEPASRSVLRDFAMEFDEAAFAAALRDDIGEDEPVTAAADAQHEAAAWSHAVAPSLAAVETVERHENADEDAEASVIASASALLSAQAGERVAAAFDHLAGAIRDGQMQSMEEMSRAMLRPMLQEWLDDNLPRIVERLVRDEIERVARGPRRPA